MINNINKDIRTDSSGIKLRIAPLMACLLLTVAPVLQSQNTKPSDVFFGSPSELQIAEEKVGLRSIGQEVGKNYLSPRSIIAKDVVLRGWLTCASDRDPNNPNWTCPGAVVPNKDIIGIVDMHYELMLDYDFIVSTYGANAGILNGAMVPGHGPDTWDTQATPLPMKNPLANTASGIDINSFWLPTSVFVPKFHVELNAWHPNSSHRNCQWVFGNPVSCSAHNFEGRGPAPAGWLEKDYGPVETNSSQSWWPFDTDDPDGLTGTDLAGNVLPYNLQVGDYVEMKGTLWQDNYHHDEKGPDTYYTYCWNVNPFQNQGGWLELHPVDSISRRVSAPGYSPYDVTPVSDPTASAKQGVKRILGVSLCSDAQGASNDVPYTAMREAVCPDKNYGLDDPNSNLHARPPQPLVPHYLKVVDGRFTDTAGVGAATTHKVDVVADCVYIQDYWPPGLKSAHYKATYVVWWTPATSSISTGGSNLGNVVRLPNSGTTNAVIRTQQSQLQLQTQLPALAATVSSTGPSSSPVTDTVTVTTKITVPGKGGQHEINMPLAGVTVTVGNSTFVTNAGGVVVITHAGCFTGPVARVGNTTAPRRTPVPCNWTATATKDGYQTATITLP